MKKMAVVITCVGCCLGLWQTADAQETGQWGVGAFVDYAKPTLGLADRWAGVPKGGITLTYTANPKISVEVEYHYSLFGDGSLETTPFTWAVDKRDYVSQNAVHEMRINSFLLNTLIHFQDRSPQRGLFALFRDRNRALRLPHESAEPDLSRSSRGAAKPVATPARSDRCSHGTGRKCGPGRKFVRRHTTRAGCANALQRNFRLPEAASGLGNFSNLVLSNAGSGRGSEILLLRGGCNEKTCLIESFSSTPDLSMCGKCLERYDGQAHRRGSRSKRGAASRRQRGDQRTATGGECGFRRQIFYFIRGSRHIPGRSISGGLPVHRARRCEDDCGFYHNSEIFVWRK